MGSQGLSLLLCSVLLSTTVCYGDEAKYDTIVVGMGAAGTLAASRLARAGKKVLALDAQDHIGGRVHTVPFGDGVVELGAEWIHGTEDSRVYETAINNSIPVVVQDFKSIIVQSDGKQADAVVDEIIEKGFEFYNTGTEKPEPRGTSLTKKIMDYMQEKTPEVFNDKMLMNHIIELFSLMIENYEAADDWNDVNSADDSEDLGGNLHTSWGRNGYKTFFDLVLNKYKDGPGMPSLDIKLKMEVTKIEWPQKPEDKVKVTTKDGTVYEANNVIVTISLGVLKDKYKTLFSPALPQEKVTAIEKIQMGKIGKIIFSFPTPWWPSQNSMYGFLWREEDVKKLSPEDQWLRKIVGVIPTMGCSNCITMWTCGKATEQAEILPEDKVKDKSLHLLKQFTAANLTIPEPTGMLRSKWFANEFTRGTYTYESMIAASHLTARSDLAAPLKDSADTPRVLFAGEATHQKRFGTVHGAAETGIREAMRLGC
ncbi:flavin containing amine oxidoreductase domain-containing protein [Phthorimaea operculella]|nr:flavin containing amine oxidoreductase domain-containing protein [Phthorimaea operculella]